MQKLGKYSNIKRRGVAINWEGFYCLKNVINFIGMILVNEIIKVSSVHSTIHHLYVALFVHHPESNPLASSYI